MKPWNGMNITTDLLHGLPVEKSILHLDAYNRELQYSQARFEEEVDRLKQWLAGKEVLPGDNIMILASQGIPALVAIVATMAAGAAAVPVHPDSGVEVLAQIVSSVKPRCCFIDRLPGDAFLSELDPGCTLVSLCEGREDLSDASREIPSYTFVMAGITPASSPEPLICEPESTALIVHSSGSQGVPKGIIYTHARLKAFLHYHNFLYAQYSGHSDAFIPGSPLLCTLPLSHLAGLAISLMAIMLRRTVVLLDKFIPHQYLHIVQREQPNMLMLLPGMYLKLLRDATCRDQSYPFLDFCLTVAEDCPPDLPERVEEIMGALVVVGYGMSECQSGLGYSHQELHDGSVRPGSCGRYLYGEVCLVDGDGDGNEQTDQGELWVRNASVQPCYTRQALNEAKFFNGWYRTGDLFYRDPDGYFYHRGRVDDMFVHNGKNIYPEEVENIVIRFDGVEGCCLAPIRDVHGCTVPALLVESHNPPDRSALLAYYLQQGASHAIPNFILHTRALPTLSNGKLDRIRCREMLQSAFAGQGGTGSGEQAQAVSEERVGGGQ